MLRLKTEKNITFTSKSIPMKKSFSVLLSAVLFLTIFISCMNRKTNVLDVLLVTGGHRYDTSEFHALFTEMEGLNTTILYQPQANRLIASGDAEKYDVLVFYDMWREIDAEEILGYEKLLEKGKGFVFLHHSLVSYQDWEDFRNIVGGKYHSSVQNGDSSRLSNYTHDIEMQVMIEKEHAVTEGLDDFVILDEGYGNIEVLPEVELLLRTNHPNSSANIGWTHMYKNSNIVYLMLGHDKNAYSNPAFQTLLKNSIHFTAGK
jgi:hypothetical protein